MATLTLTTFLSLDGVMQGPGGPEEDRSGGFDRGGWVWPFADEEFGAQMSKWFAAAGGFVLGRRTYEIFAGYWPQVTDENDPIASGLNSLPKHVASTTLTSADWHNSTLLTGDVPQQVAALKQRAEGELQIHGSGVLARSLMAHGLIDEYRLLTFPVVLGAGKRLFADGVEPAALKPTGARLLGSGIAVHTYEPAGKPAFGSV